MCTRYRATPTCSRGVWNIDPELVGTQLHGTTIFHKSCIASPASAHAAGSACPAASAPLLLLCFICSAASAVLRLLCFLYHIGHVASLSRRSKLCRAACLRFIHASPPAPPVCAPPPAVDARGTRRRNSQPLPPTAYRQLRSPPRLRLSRCPRGPQRLRRQPPPTCLPCPVLQRPSSALLFCRVHVVHLAIRQSRRGIRPGPRRSGDDACLAE
jgi:hypothetical protein